MQDYAAQYSVAQPVIKAKQICREQFPVKRDERFERFAKHLGELFLNRACYEEGDWILSVSETG